MLGREQFVSVSSIQRGGGAAPPSSSADSFSLGGTLALREGQQRMLSSWKTSLSTGALQGPPRKDDAAGQERGSFPAHYQGSSSS